MRVKMIPMSFSVHIFCVSATLVALIGMDTRVSASEEAVRELSIGSFGAVSGGSTPSTAAIQKAVDQAAAAGGGRVIVPKGDYLSGPFVLKSGVDFYLSEGAVLRMSDDPSLFPVTRNSRQSFIAAENAHDIRLSGKGVIDGQGAGWWKAYLAEKSAATDAPRRPQLISFTNCERVTVEDIKTLNPPNTHYSFKHCRDLTIRNIKAEAPDDSPNTDALNLSHVKNVLITGSDISTGDDNIVLLCGDGRIPGVPEVENVTIRGCRIGFGHGISIGSHTMGGVRNVLVEQVSFDRTTSGIRLKAREDNGGIVENIHFRDIKMKDVRYPIYITSYYPKVPAHPSQETALRKRARIPVWRNMTIESLVAEGCSNSLILWGHPRESIQGLTLRDVKISAKTGALVFHARDVLFSNVVITDHAGPPLSTFRARVTGMSNLPVGDANIKFK